MKLPVPAPHFVAALLSVACLSAACAPATPAPSGSAAASAATLASTDLSTWANEMTNLEADGTRSLKSALRLFAMAFGDVPGVDAHQTAGVLSASPAVRVVLGHLDELTADQKAAVQRYAMPAEDAPAFDVPTSPAPSPAAFTSARGMGLAARAPAALSTQEQQLSAVMAGFVNYYLSHGAEGSGSAIPVSLEPGASPLAWSTLSFGPDSSYSCHIYVSSSANPGSPTTAHILAHEVFHCLQGLSLAKSGLSSGPTASIAGNIPSWIWEGGSEYAALQASLTSAGHEDAWPTYLTQPNIPLFSRSYDAVGFYAHLVETGILTPFGVFDALTTSKLLINLPSEEIFVFSGAGDSIFLDSWASSLARDPSRGVAWDTSGPLITSESAPRAAITMSDGDTEAVAQEPFTNGLYAVNVQADLVQIAIGGHARLSDGTFETTDLGGATFCVNPEGCKPCPDSPELNAQQIAPGFLLAVSGGQIGASGTLTASTIDKDCETATPGQALRAHMERDAIPADAFMAGTVFDVTTCDGAYGHWSGYMNAGGIGMGNQVVVAFQQLPIEFSFSGAGSGAESTTVTAAGVVEHVLPVPTFIDVSYPLVIETDGSTMSVTGINTWVTGGDPTTPVVVPLEPAPPGTCE